MELLREPAGEAARALRSPVVAVEIETEQVGAGAGRSGWEAPPGDGSEEPGHQGGWTIRS